jgi:PAS domain S-box-containing protein
MLQGVRSTIAMNGHPEKIVDVPETVERLRLELEQCRRELRDSQRRLEQMDGIVAHVSGVTATVDPDERIFRTIVDAMPTQVWYAAPDGVVEFQNRSWLRFAGISPESVRDNGWRNAIHPDDVASYEHRWQEIRTSQMPGEFEARFRRFDGKYRHCLMHVVPVRGARGEVVRWYGTSTDIHDPQRTPVQIVDDRRDFEAIARGEPLPSVLEVLRRLAEENSQLRAEFRDLFEEAPIPYVYEGVDTRIIRANSAALRVLGLRPEEVAGAIGKSFVADTPENQRRLSEAFQSVERGRETGGVEIELRRRDNGKPVWVQWWSKPAPNGEYTRTMMVDITDRVLIEQTKSALEFTLESGQVGDWDLDLINDTSRRSLRHDQCFGYTELIPEAQWGSKVFLQHVHPEDRKRVEEEFHQALNELRPLRDEFRVVWADGSVHWLATRASVYQLVDGKATRMLGIVMDITARKEAEEILRETKAALEFTLSATHIGDWDLDLTNDTSRRSLRHDQCFGYDAPIPEADWGIEVFSQHLHPEDRARVVDSMRLAAHELRDWNSEFRVLWPDGSEHWIAASGSIYRTREGKATRMLGIVMDVTERKRAEEALAASEQLARRQIDALTRTLDALATESVPDRLMEHIARAITEQFGAHSISVWRRDMTSDSVDFEFAFEDGRVVTRADPRFAGMDLSLPMEDRWPWPEVFRTGRPDLIRDIRKVPAFALRDRLLDLGIVSVLLVPMWIAGRLEGAIGIRFDHERVLRTEEMELAQTLANHVMMALQLVRLSAQSRESAVIDERNRLARDIHDTLAQGFTGVIVQLEAAEDARLQGLPDEADEHLDRARSLARDSLNEARRSVRALRPQALEREELFEALKTLLTKMTAGTGLRSEFILQGQSRQLPQGWDENILRIAQEALTNALRHADASHFRALVAFDQDGVRLELNDTGSGFDPEGKHGGFGLLGIKERVDRMGGQLKIRSSKQSGTALSITLPLPHSSGHGSP